MIDITNLSELVTVAIPQHNKPDCLMVKRSGAYAPVSAREVIDTVQSLSARLQGLGLNRGDRVGILSENRAEWTYADLAVICAAAISVPIYSTLPAKQIEYILNDSEMEIVFVSTETQLNKILEIRKDAPRLQHVILFDPIPLPEGVLGLSSLISEGKEILKRDPDIVKRRCAEINPDDVFTIVYTSGTTGEPKGVMLSHNNMISNVKGIMSFFQFSSTDCSVSFLPLSHVFERMCGYYSLLWTGCTIAYAESVEALSRNLQEVKPTILISVPRVYEKSYSSIMDTLASKNGLKKKTMEWGLKVAAEYTESKFGNGKSSATLGLRYAIADMLVFSQIRARLGGRLRLLASGGAALPRQLALFFYGIGLTILEGYGLTETSPVIAANRPDKFKFGTVGPPIPGVEVKIADDGEIITRGPHVMKGYFKKPKATEEAVIDGWFHTGDIGEIDADGCLRITDRKKDLIITSAGKNIAPQFVENALKTSRYVTQIVVVGDKRKFPSALVVPNMENLRKFAASRGIPDQQMLTHQDVIKEVERDLDALSKDLAPFERVKKIAFLEKEFTIESGELTPSLKIKRNVVEKKYRDVIDSLYREPAMR